MRSCCSPVRKLEAVDAKSRDVEHAPGLLGATLTVPRTRAAWSSDPERTSILAILPTLPLDRCG